jgi:thiamine pyrophosphokinase
VTAKFEQKLPVGTTVSIISMTDETIASTSGLAFELTNSVLPKGGHGISNKSVKETVMISVHKGGILLMINEA